MLFFLLACKNDHDFNRADKTDTFIQEGTDEVDILLVIDNSVSMKEEQELVAAGFNSFLDALAQDSSELDLHIGIVTTDMDYANPSRGLLVGGDWLTGAEADFAEQFSTRVQVGTDGSDKEQGLAAAWGALAFNEGFIRTDANLGLIFVSDENDCSHDGAFPEDGDGMLCYERQEDLAPLQEYILRFQGVKSTSARVIASSIVGPEVSAGCDTANPGVRYTDFSSKLSGFVGSICETDYGTLFDAIGSQIIAPATTFTLTDQPLDGSIEVDVDGEVIPEDPETGWWYDEEYMTIHFDGSYVPPTGATIHVYYVLAGG